MRHLRRIFRAIRKRLLSIVRRFWFRTKDIRFAPPNFIFFCFPKNNKQVTVIDVGCGSVAEFSTYLIDRYHARCFGVDPTEKHKPALSSLVRKYQGRFVHIPFAICAKNGTLNFFESRVNESGSLMADHINVVRDKGNSYQVRCVTPVSLLDHLGLDSADILKLDIEGAEYQLLETLGRSELLPFKQIFIEFHHHAVERYTYSDTLRAVENICSFGFKSYSLDNHNYLFRRLH